MEAKAPHPSRPRTRDDNDPAVIRFRAYNLEYLRKKKLENRDEYLRKKKEYNARHKAEHAAYLRKWRANRKGAPILEETVVLVVPS